MQRELEAALSLQPLSLKNDSQTSDIQTSGAVDFRTGDDVVLAAGPYRGTPGIFLTLRGDVRWADITELNGKVRSHPVEWLSHVNVPAAEHSEVTSH